MGTSDLVTQRSRQLFQYVFPCVGGLIMIAWPAALQLTICMIALISAAQATMFKIPWFRDLFGMQPLPKPAAPATPNRQLRSSQGPSRTPSESKTESGVVGSVKGVVSEIMKNGKKFSPMSIQQNQKGRLTNAERRHAETYEKRRRRELEQEERGSVEARFEREEEQVTLNREREERLRRRAEKKAARHQ